LKNLFIINGKNINETITLSSLLARVIAAYKNIIISLKSHQKVRLRTKNVIIQTNFGK